MLKAVIIVNSLSVGNPSDKILYPRSGKRRSASFPAHRSPDRRGSFRIWGSARRLRRSASTRTLSKHCTDSSSSTDYPNSSDSAQTPKKPSLLSRIFRRSKRSQCQINSFSAQFPPLEWFNSKAIHLHSIGTQTTAADKDSAASLPSYYSNSEVASSRSATLPRRHHRQPSNDSNYVTSREQSPSLRQLNALHNASGSLPRNSGTMKSPLIVTRSNTSSRKTSHSSLSPKVCTSNNDIYRESPIKEIAKPTHDTIKTASLDSLKPSHINKNFHSKSGVSESPPSAIQDLTNSFKTSVSLDNSGPSSLESHKSSLTSGPSSLESHRTVISNPSLPPIKRTLTRRNDAKYKSSSTANSQIPHSNSFTLQVMTNQNGTTSSSSSNNGMTATINGGSTANTKIYVQNSPVRSVITFENGRVDSKPNVVIINGNEQTSKVAEPTKYSKNTNNVSLNNSPKVDDKIGHMNNSRKLSLHLPPSTKEGLDYKNIFKNAQSNQTSPESPYGGFTRNSFCSSPPSPTKSFDSICEFNKYMTDSKTSELEKNMLGSEPNISYKEQDYRDKTLTRDRIKSEQFPSLSDLSFNFTSLAAQKILKGVSINSIDTLVELNTAAIEKQNNCDVVHTDFGLV